MKTSFTIACVLNYGGNSSSNQPLDLPELKKVKAFSKITLPETKLLTSTSAGRSCILLFLVC